MPTVVCNVAQDMSLFSDTGFPTGTTIGVGVTLPDNFPIFGLIQFDLSSIPQNAIIGQAVVSLFLDDTRLGGDNIFEGLYNTVHRVIRLWIDTEANKTDATSTDEWELSWASGNTDRYITPVSSFVTPPVQTGVEFNLPASLVQDWLDNGENYGIRITGPTVTTDPGIVDWARYASSDQIAYPVPTLTVTYALPSVSATMPDPIVQEAQHRFFLIPLIPKVVFTGRVTSSPTNPYMTINWYSGATGTAVNSGAPIGEAGLNGNTVWFGSTAGGNDRGTVRMRTWTPASPTNPTTGVLSIAETDDVGPQIETDDYITIYREFRLHPIFPRQTLSGDVVTFFEDYDISYTNQTEEWRPIAAPGPPAVGFLEGGTGTVQIQFVGDRSKLFADGASWSSWLWSSPGSNELTSTSQGTQASPVTFTYSTPGEYLVELKATDSNGNYHRSWTHVFIIDPDNPDDVAYTEFDSISDSIDFSQGGGEANFTARGVASIAQFPRDTLCVLACRPDLTTMTATWPFRSNVLFVGYIVGDSISQDPVDNTVSFRAVTINRLMANTKTYPFTLTDNDSPTEWVDGTNFTADHIASFLYRWRSTLATMTSVIFSFYTGRIQRQDFGPSNLYTQAQAELMADQWTQVASSFQSVLRHEINYNWMLTSERSGVTTRKTLTRNIWVEAVNISERGEYETQASKCKTSGILYPGGGLDNVEPLFSEAPEDLSKSFGKEIGKSDFILTSQSDLNVRCGFMLARDNQFYFTVGMRFINDGSFDAVPQEIFPAVIQSDHNNRGLDWTPDLIPRRIRRSYNHELGIVESDVEFEPSSTGPPGVTVSLPRTPPTQFFTPPTPQWQPGDIALLLWSPENGVYYRGLGGFTWEDRNANLSGTNLNPTWGGIDPWWWTADKQDTYNPDFAILFDFTPTFAFRTDNAGLVSWSDITPGTGTTPSMDFVGLGSDIFVNKTHYVIGREIEGGSGGTGTSRLFKTTNDGTNWTVAHIT